MDMRAKVGAKLSAVVTAVRNDANFSKLGWAARSGAREVRAGAGHYLLNKIPIAIWIPSYIPVWLVGDVLAGLSVGLILFPQAVMFSALAGVPVQAALTASWVPGLVYSAMGTSKDISIGPSFMPSLVVGGMIAQIPQSAGSPTLTMAVLSMCVGLWSLLMGLLNLGALFDAVSVPIFLGFTCGMAIVAYMGQIAQLFGMIGVTPLLSQLVSQLIAKLPETNPAALGLGAGCVVFLVVLQKVEKKWGGRNEALRIIASSRNLFILLLTTGISYILNQDRSKPLWLVVGPVKTQIQVVQVLNLQLIKELFFPSFTLWFCIAVEHVLVAKALGRLSGYTVDPSQELMSLGMSNIANSFMGGLPVSGGDMSRAGVNSTSGVKSPLSGLFVAAVVGVGMYALSAVAMFIPLPAVAAVIIVAVIDAMPSPGEMSKYWKWSFVDWATFLLTFNTTLVVTPETGFETGVGILVVYTLLRAILTRPRAVLSTDLESQYGLLDKLSSWDVGEEIPQGVCVMRVQNDMIYTNATKTKERIVDTAMTAHSAVCHIRNDNNRVWNDCRDHRVRYLRRRAGITQHESSLPKLQALVLDMSPVSFIDSSGLHAIEDIKSELRSYSGSGVEFRFFGLNDAVRRRFKRAAWTLASPYDGVQEIADEEETLVDHEFDYLPHAIRMPTRIMGAIPELSPLPWERDEISAANSGEVRMVPRDMI